MTLTVWILGDQLLENHPALAAAEAVAGRENLSVVLVESRSLAARLPYQRKKLVLLFSAMRHMAERLAGQGYRVECLAAPDLLHGLRQHLSQVSSSGLYGMAASTLNGRRFQDSLAGRLGIPVTLLPNCQFLGERYQPFPNSQPAKRYVMEYFYRAMRQHFQLLLEPDGSPLGGKWNFDAENRQRLPADLNPPTRLRFPPDALTRQVMAEVAVWEPAVGSVAGFDLAVTPAQAGQALEDFLDQRLALFGPYEDAMTRRSELLYHSLLSPYLNLGLLDPLQVARQAEARYHAGQAPLQSVEGFIRQVVGWREYVYWQYWRQAASWKTANYWQAQRRLPAFFWTGETDLHCLGQAIRRALQTGYTHHIVRLMLLSNYCLLAGIQPNEVNAWFSACYVDAYEWVMQPNVLGMGLFADGGLTATKPYIGSANYISKMSDYCQGCRYQPRQRTGVDACPYNYLYWNFLIDHETALRANPRLGPAVLGLGRLGLVERQAIQLQAREYLDGLD